MCYRLYSTSLTCRSGPPLLSSPCMFIFIKLRDLQVLISFTPFDISEELEYPAGAIKKEVVNLVEGANFTPDFLKLVSLNNMSEYAILTRSQNPNATLPTLVVDGKSYVSTAEVIDYLVKNAPKKVAPGTSFITKIHEDSLDPNFPLLLTVS